MIDTWCYYTMLFSFLKPTIRKHSSHLIPILLEEDHRQASMETFVRITYHFCRPLRSCFVEGKC